MSWWDTQRPIEAGRGIKDYVEPVQVGKLDELAKEIRSEAEWLNNDRENWPPQFGSGI